MPDLRVLSVFAHEFKTCLIGVQRSYRYPHGPIAPVSERHRLMMHRIVETDPRRPEMHAADDCGGLPFGGGRQDYGSRNLVIRKDTGMVRAVARFIARFIVRKVCSRAHQRMASLDNFPGPFTMDRIVLQPLTLALKGIRGQ